MKYFAKLLLAMLFVGCTGITGILFMSNQIGTHFPSAQAQSSVDSIKAKIKEVVSRVDGKVTVSTKTRLVEIISSKIKTSTNATIVDIYVFFLREVKKLRTSGEIIAISTNSPSSVSSPTTTNTTRSGPDFSVTYASIPGTVQLDQKFATLTIRIKNHGTTYSSDGQGSLKFGCKGVDGTLYPYRSYLESAPPITTNGEVSIEVANVYVGNLTSNKGFKLLVCKIDSSDLVTETNEDNNFVNVTMQVGDNQ